MRFDSSGVFDETNTRSIELIRQRQKVVKSVLSQDQRKRLAQIALQLQGPSAILESMFAGNLNLTRAQTTAIQETFLDYLISNAQSPLDERSPVGLPSSSFRPDEWLDADMKAELLGLVLKRLTPKQIEAWSEIVGPEFTLDQD